MKLFLRIAVLGIAAIACFALAQTFIGNADPRAGDDLLAKAMASPDKVERLYNEWKAAHEGVGGDENVRVALGFAKGLSAEYTPSRGQANLDLISGRVSVQVGNVGDQPISDVWLVDNRPGPNKSAQPEAGDAMLYLGQLEGEGVVSSLEVELGEDAFVDFDVDVVVVTQAGTDPLEAPMLFGAPSTFQRIYTQQRVAKLRQPVESPSGSGLVDVLSGSSPAMAAVPANAFVTSEVTFDGLVAKGADLFFNGTFEGNGRSCGTCHPAKFNLTINPAFISTLPNSDPLFVAENVPALAQLEVTPLLRGAGLILENIDGFEDPTNKFVMRSVPHTLGMSQSVAGPDVPFDNTFNPAFGIFPPAERTGWSGDGAPGSGSLRDFATGAVIQHYPLTLNRVPGVDFRLPNDAELDALEVFMLALGRTEEVQLVGPDAIQFKSPLAQRGNIIFNRLDSGGGQAGKCGICHFNAGANLNPGFFNGIFGIPVTGGNANFGTGVEDDRDDRPAALIDPANNKRDGGFGTVAHIDANCIGGKGGFGTVTPEGGALPPGLCEEDFNTVSLIEAADTAPFFHDNSADTLEGAIGFYNGSAFNNSVGAQLIATIDTNGIGINLNSTGVTAIGAMLRVLNALENIRNAIELLDASLGELRANAHTLIGVAEADLFQAAKVLDQDNNAIDQKAVDELLTASAFADRAIRQSFRSGRERDVRSAIDRAQRARARLIH